MLLAEGLFNLHIVFNNPHALYLARYFYRTFCISCRRHKAAQLHATFKGLYVYFAGFNLLIAEQRGFHLSGYDRIIDITTGTFLG